MVAVDAAAAAAPLPCHAMDEEEGVHINYLLLLCLRAAGDKRASVGE